MLSPCLHPDDALLSLSPHKCFVPPLSPPLTISVYAAPAGHPGMGQLEELGAQGALGAPWAAEADVESSIQRYRDAPSWP